MIAVAKKTAEMARADTAAKTRLPDSELKNIVILLVLGFGLRRGCQQAMQE